MLLQYLSVLHECFRCNGDYLYFVMYRSLLASPWVLLYVHVHSSCSPRHWGHSMHGRVPPV